MTGAAGGSSTAAGPAGRDPVADARDLVTAAFPEARWALLAGSVTGRHRTAGSDLDIVVLLPDGDARAPHRDSQRFRGWPVELFVHDEASLAYYGSRDGRRPVLHRMVATGTPLVGEPAAWQEASAGVLAAGPDPLTGPQRDRARYALTDLLDDLVHATDTGERSVVSAAAWTAAAELALATARHWSGGGKWLLRELRDLDADLAERWLAGYGDPAAVAGFARDVLDSAGGPLFEGYRVAGERP